jgi:hypothetical protein
MNKDFLNQPERWTDRRDYVAPPLPDPPWYSRYWKGLLALGSVFITVIAFLLSNYSDIKEAAEDFLGLESSKKSATAVTPEPSASSQPPKNTPSEPKSSSSEPGKDSLPATEPSKAANVDPVQAPLADPAPKPTSDQPQNP